MPPKANSADLRDADLRFILSVMINCEEIRPDWNIIARENGISYARNASTKFGGIVKKLGYSYKDGKLSVDDDDDPETPAKAKNEPKNRKTPSSNKRKAEVSKGSATSSKKAKKQSNVKTEADLNDDPDFKKDHELETERADSDDTD